MPQTQATIQPITIQPADAATLLKHDTATVSHHSNSAPTSCARGHSATYFGRLEIDSAATINGQTIHQRTPNMAQLDPAMNSQNSADRSACQKVGDL